MGGTQLKEKYNEEHEVILNIILDKKCYYPGEILSGYLDLQPKYNINQTIFNDTQVIFKITQFQEYSYTTGSGDDETTVYVREDSDVLTQETRLNYFCGANLLLGIKIPFSIQIPLEIQPTFYYLSHFIKHFFCVELPGIKAKRALIIIIKGYQFYTNENKLLKLPAFGFGDFYKKKKNEYKGGKVSCLLELPKNSFISKETIPFKINLDCSELNMEVKTLRISLNKYIYFNCKNDHKKHYMTKSRKELVYKELYIKENQTKYELNDILNLPFDFSNSQEIYTTFESMKTIEVDYHFYGLKKEITPFCVGGLISCEYILKVEIIYKSSRSSNSFELPIEIVDKEDNGFNPLIQINNNNKYNYLNDEANKNNYDINYIDNYDNRNNNENKDDFEIIEHDDFQKAFFGNNKK